MALNSDLNVQKYICFKHISKCPDNGFYYLIVFAGQVCFVIDSGRSTIFFSGKMLLFFIHKNSTTYCCMIASMHVSNAMYEYQNERTEVNLNDSTH